MTTKNTLALFDFDGTLYKKDSLIAFTKFAKGNRTFYTGMLWLLPKLIGMKLGILKNEAVKTAFVTHFFKGMDSEQFRWLGKNFALQKIDGDLNSKIKADFLKHIASGHVVCIVSASFPEWIEPWSIQYGVKVIGTNVEVADGKLTGKLASKNCFGIEKINRIKAILNMDEFESVCVYGSGKGDLEMLRLAT